jgi:hypothetical protein
MLALDQYSWKVLDDAAGSDHLPILTTYGSKENFTDILLLMFDLTRHVSMSTFAELVLNSLPEITNNMPLHEEYEASISTEQITEKTNQLQTQYASLMKRITFLILTYPETGS